MKEHNWLLILLRHGPTIRIELPGAVYHLMTRGNQDQKICADDRDRKLWLATVGEACCRTGWLLTIFRPCHRLDRE